MEFLKRHVLFRSSQTQKILLFLQNVGKTINFLELKSALFLQWKAENAKVKVI